jgi:hypothetical protein
VLLPVLQEVVTGDGPVGQDAQWSEGYVNAVMAILDASITGNLSDGMWSVFVTALERYFKSGMCFAPRIPSAWMPSAEV